MTLVLASKSASRQAMLREAGVPFTVQPADIDERALEAAAENAARNHVGLRLAHSRQPLSEQFDIVIANILTNPLCVLAPLIATRVKAGGRLARRRAHRHWP